jgi:hypothetical protein
MIRKRISNQRRSERASPQPPRRRILSIPSPSKPRDDRDPQTDDDIRAKLRDSFRAEGKRVAEAIRQEIGGDLLMIVRESLGNMKSSTGRRRVLRLLDCRLGVPLEKIQKELGIE